MHAGRQLLQRHSAKEPHKEHSRWRARAAPAPCRTKDAPARVPRPLHPAPRRMRRRMILLPHAAHENQA